MRILGIDPGLKCTGYGLIEHVKPRVKLLDAETIKPKVSDPIEKRLNCVHEHVDRLIRTHKPDVMVLEKLFAHRNHPTTASLLGHVRGVICVLCAQYKLQLVEHSVKRIRKAVTGNGAATKVQTREMVSHILHIKSQSLGLDASDALALALGHVYMSSKGRFN